MSITVLGWNERNEAAANDVTYRIRRDETTGWYWCWAAVPTAKEPARLTRPGNYHGTEKEAKELAQADAEKRGESDRARESGVKRIKG
jgi:hypothetical protein